MPEPSYCSLVTIVNSVPTVQEMEFFKAYFEVFPNAQKLNVVVKVPSECYFLESHNNQAPSGGPCGGPDELQECIYLNRKPNCSSQSVTVLSIDLDYVESSQGEFLNIYIVDNSESSAVKGASKTRKRIDIITQ